MATVIYGTEYDLTQIPESSLNYVLYNAADDTENTYHIIVGLAQLEEYNAWAEQNVDDYLTSIYTDYVIFAECSVTKIDNVDLTGINEDVHCCLGWEGGHCFGPVQGAFAQYAYDEENWAKIITSLETEVIDETIEIFDESNSIIVEGKV